MKQAPTSEPRRLGERIRKPSARFWSVLALAACAVTSAGCEPEDPPEDPNAIEVGALLPFTGELSAYGAAYERALILAVERVNDAGGVSGRRLRLVPKDTHSSVERGLESARALSTPAWST